MKKVTPVVWIAILSWTACQYQHYEEIKPNAPVVSCDTASYATYDKDIAPIFRTYCLECHNSKDADALGEGTVLDNYDDVWNNASASYRDVTGIHYTMPKDKAKMDTCDIRKLKVWIDSGKN